ncbi:2-oxo acid dehydrogenase subunit E2 [bacterium]|nr:2-oxo acid dehydrogenase subunit E2 [bacterium]
MATQDVRLPDIGEGVTEGELIKWLVKEGDSVSADQPIAEVMTDKATVEVPTPYAGTVKSFKYSEGDMIPIETVMLVLDASGGGAEKSSSKKESKSEAPPAQAAQSAPAARTSQAPVTAAPAPQGGGMDVYPPASEIHVLATPATRRLAREMNVDINQIQGSGLAGRVTREDVMSKQSPSSSGVNAGVTAKANIPRPAYKGVGGDLEERVSMRGIRKKIAENMQMSKHVIPHFTLMEEARADELMKLRSQAKSAGEKYGVKVTYMPFIMKALIATCREFPMFNASIDDAAQEIVYKKYFNLGFAADTPNGLMVPVIKNADQKTLLEVSKDINELGAKARDGKLALEEMKGATITVTNIGSVGGLYATPIINHPEVAIFGMYKIQERPIFVGDQVKKAHFMNFTITCDHRLIDGAVAANFMKAFVSRIENPSHLMLDMI